MALNLYNERNDFLKEMRMEAMAIILEFLTVRQGSTERSVFVTYFDGSFLITGHRDTADRLSSCVDTIVRAVIEADYLRYAEEVASHLICQTYVRKRSPYGYYDLIDDYSYAPEIQKFIKLTAMYIQKAFDRESEG